MNNNNNTGLLRTPNANMTYSSSDSNQSPPSYSFKVDTGIQTDSLEVLNSEYLYSNPLIFRQMEDKQKELLRLNAELKSKYEKEKKKNQSSRETLKNLLIQKSRMERKQVFFL